MYATLIGITAPLSWSLIPLITYYLKHIDAMLMIAIAFTMFFVVEILRQFIFANIANPFKIPKLYYLYGIVGVFGFHVFYFSALRIAPIMPVYLIINSTSLFIILYSKLLHNIHISSKHKFAFLINFTAIVLIAFTKATETFESYHLIGYLFAFIAANCWAFYTVKNRDYMDLPIRKINYVILISGLLAFIWFVLFSDNNIPNLAAVDFELLFLLALWPTGYSMFAWVYGAKFGDIRFLSIVSLINPVLGSIWLILAGIEQFNWIVLISLCLILFGSFMAKTEGS